mmetsp:Transcript_96865/g.279614  ORF Transcript_96865/g.279614 Transcript_96865/m.279614 type:complete len:215 (+) Transcript_96865:176-820(+)
MMMFAASRLRVILLAILLYRCAPVSSSTYQYFRQSAPGPPIIDPEGRSPASPQLRKNNGHRDKSLRNMNGKHTQEPHNSDARKRRTKSKLKSKASQRQPKASKNSRSQKASKKESNAQSAKSPSAKDLHGDSPSASASSLDSSESPSDSPTNQTLGPHHGSSSENAVYSQTLKVSHKSLIGGAVVVSAVVIGALAHFFKSPSKGVKPKKHGCNL